MVKQPSPIRHFLVQLKESCKPAQRLPLLLTHTHVHLTQTSPFRKHPHQPRWKPTMATFERSQTGTNSMLHKLAWLVECNCWICVGKPSQEKRKTTATTKPSTLLLDFSITKINQERFYSYYQNLNNWLEWILTSDCAWHRGFDGVLKRCVEILLLKQAL